MDELPARDSVEIDRYQLRKLRHDKRSTQAQVADAAKISFGYLAHLERGTRTHVSRDVFDRLCVALDVASCPELLEVDRSAVAS